MKLGAFSVSLAVKDIGASRAFYEKLGFGVVAGEQAQNWLILRSEDGHTIGLFQGMFERNALTFNPGWDAQCQTLAEFDDVRALQRHFKQQGLTLNSETDESASGPGHITLTYPDGNPVLFDQHV